MTYSGDEVRQYIAEEDVRFIRMAFCDILGRQKNVSVLSDELDRAFEQGIAFDASAVAGFGDEVHSDLLLRPDASTLVALPWGPEHSRVVRMFCNIYKPDGTPFAGDARKILRETAAAAEREGYKFAFGSEMEFYLFYRNESGAATKIPYDNAGYMDVPPEDKGSAVRREVCLTLEQMGIRPECSHHEEGPGQNEIDFRYDEPLTSADNAIAFRSAVDTIAARSGLCADFSPKPLIGQAGNGMHINISAKSADGEEIMPYVIAGILAHIREMTVFLNRTEESYLRFGGYKAPRYISWSSENRSQLIRIPAAIGEYRRAELRSPDPLCNPYLAFTLLIAAGLDGIRRRLPLPASADINLYNAPREVCASFETLPGTLTEAKELAEQSEFIADCLPQTIIDFYTR